jgi:glycine cleavage system transcriptional repressor
MAKPAASSSKARRMWLLTAVGKDQPGIVAHVTRQLFELGGNLEDSAMTRLGGEFAIMLMVSAPVDVGEERLAEAFEPLARQLKLAIHLKALTRAELSPRRKGRPYQICVYGADRSGIVYQVSEALAKRRVNITDVSTHRTTPTGARHAPPLYLMLLEVELPPRVDAEALQTRLRALAKRLGVEVTIRSVETLVL